MKAVQVVSKHSFIHTLAREFGVNVIFLDRRWWEVRPRMKITIPTPTLKDIVDAQSRVVRHLVMRGYTPGVHMKMAEIQRV